MTQVPVDGTRTYGSQAPNWHHQSSPSPLGMCGSKRLENEMVNCDRCCGIGHEHESPSPNSNIIPLVTLQIPPAKGAQRPPNYPLPTKEALIKFLGGPVHPRVPCGLRFPPTLNQSFPNRCPSLPLQHRNHPVKFLNRSILNQDFPFPLAVPNPHPQPQNGFQRPLLRPHIRIHPPRPANLP